MSGFDAMMFNSFVDWTSLKDIKDGQGGYARTFSGAVRLRACFAPVIPSSSVSADQLDSRTRATILCAPDGYAVHEGDRVTTPDSRVWEIKSVAPFTTTGMPIENPDVLLLSVVEKQGL